MSVRQIIEFFTVTIFRREYKSSWLNWLVRQYKLFFYTARGLQEHGTLVRCAALTFYTLISIVPILAVVFAIVKGFGIIDDLIENLYSLFPKNPEIIDYVVEFANKALENTKSGVVAAVGIITLFWAVIRVFGSIESAFNNIWEVTSTRSLARKYSDYIAVIVVAPILWAAANGINSYAQGLFGGVDAEWVVWVSKLMSIVVMWVMFSFLYYIIPNTTVRVGSAIMAGVVAGTAFILFQWGYLYLQTLMTSYNAIYGSFAALPLFLMWVQYSWMILLFGGELAFAYQNIDKFDEERESLHVNYDSRRKVLLGAMLVVVRHFAAGKGAISLSEIKHTLNLPTRIVNSVLRSLVEAEQLLELPAEGKGFEKSFVPAKDVATFTVYNILEAVEYAGSSSIDLAASAELQQVSAELDRIKAEARMSQQNLKLTDIKA
ncbi:MAG: YihY/virulence factor BrkB family protein [Rikenellaceae bacterium]|nr:YihY/virulence factor BrkB family protein [Rikenellaceae bacterium]